MIDIRLPNITGNTEVEQLVQVKSYLHQLVGELNWALNNIVGVQANASTSTAASKAQENTPSDDPISTFNSVKGLILKSADIVDAYYESINNRLQGLYVAESDFGTYTEATDLVLEATSKGIEQNYTNIQQILSDIEGFESSLIEVNAHINSGILYYGENGAPVYGLEIGQRTEINGEETFNKYARFTSDKLSFYDSNDNEVAYISDKKLYITDVEITGSFSLGGFVDKVLADGSVVSKWVGGEG